MDYAEAKRIRGQSFGSRMSDKLTEGQGIGASLKATLSEGTKATMTGIKEKFDPMNIGKFFGGKLGAAVVGKLTGRSQKDMEHFTGKKSSTKIGKLESGNEMVDMLMKIYSLMQKTNEDNKKMRDDENKFKEEKEMERLRRHKELIEAITGKPYTGKASVVKKEDEFNPGGILGDILDAFGGAKSAISLLSTIGKFFVGPVGGPILIAASLGALFYAMSQASDESHETASKVSGAMDASGGATEQLSANKAFEDLTEDEKKAELARRDQLNAALKDAPWKTKYFQNKVPEFLASKGYSPEQITDLTTPIQDRKTNTAAPKPESETTSPTGSESSPAPTTMASPTGSESSPAPASTSMAQGTSSPNPGQQLNQVQGENLNAKVQETLSKGETVVNNNAISKSLSSNDTRGPLPPVRNHEETFAKMIFDSTRVV
jgi:hypothetical protein